MGTGLDALLILPPDEMEEMLGAGKAFVQKYEPLGLLYIAAVAREQGYDVKVVDAYADGLTPRDIQRLILRENPRIVGLSTLTCSGEIVYNLGRWMKRELPDTLVVLGNVHASVYAPEYLANGCCDIVVHGEGEFPFIKILEYSKGKCTLDDIPSISARDGSGLVRKSSAKTMLVEDLAALPMPARDMLNQENYRLDDISNQLYVAGKSRSTSKTMATSRGCRYRCTFCVVNQRPRLNSAMNVVDEMEILEKEFEAGYVLIIDPLCMEDADRMIAISKEHQRRGLSIHWGCDARVNCITPELLRHMEAGGCYDLSFGIESGVQRLLNRVKKGTKVWSVERTVNMIKRESNIKVGGLFILGLPGETEADSLETIRFAKGLPLDNAQFSILTPYPGSALFEELRASGELDVGVRADGTLDTSVWQRYSAYISFTDNDPIWVTPSMTNAQLKRLQKRAQREFYVRPKMIAEHVKRIRPNNVVRMLKIAAAAFI